MHYNNAEIENVTRFHVHCISNRINFFNMGNFKNCGTKFNYYTIFEWKHSRIYDTKNIYLEI